mmetsp:Transcript_6165/g.9468  ORF Transcript_6165/g.9468 Transcript_6165/m.9468 type:complete len:475 (+) Transcript_6165:81-1505(+)
MVKSILISYLTLLSTVTAYEGKEDPWGLVTIPLIPQRVHARRRRRLDRPAQEKSDALGPKVDPFEDRSSSLYQGYGTHFVDLWIGTPFQRQSVIVDTGSGVTAVPCKDCVNCGAEFHTDPYFDEDSSATFYEVSCEECSVGHCVPNRHQCSLEVSYQEGSSWVAHEVADITYLGGSHESPLENPPKDTFHLHFGCQSRVTGLFKTQLEDGIMGMDLSETSFWQQAYANGVIRSKSFSLCFSRQKVVDVISSEAGVLTLGGNDPRLHSTTMVYADLIEGSSGYFQIHVKKIYLRLGGGDSVEFITSSSPTIEQVDIKEKSLNDGGVILDSGTTFTYLTEDMAEPFDKAWRKVTGSEWNTEKAVHLSDSELLAMPVILVQLQGWTAGIQDEIAPGLAATVDPQNPDDVIVAIPPTHYMEYSDKTHKYTPRVFFTEEEGGVLGANFMMGHNILFDAENKRFGFSESTCEYAVVADSE